MTWGNSLKQQQKSIAWKGKYYISTRSKRVSSTEIKFVFNNGSVLSHLIESSTPFRDVSNVESMPEGHCHCTTNETKPGLKIKMQMNFPAFTNLFNTDSKIAGKNPKTERPTDLWDSAVQGRQDYLPKQTGLAQNKPSIWTCSTLMVATISIWIFMLYKHSFAVIVLLFPLKMSFPCYTQQLLVIFFKSHFTCPVIISPVN